MTNHGIDYGMGTCNRDKETGIRFGVIPLHALQHWAYESFEDDYGPPTCGECGGEVVEYDDEKHGEYEGPRGCSDYACEECERVYDSGDCYGEEPVSSTIDDGEYKAEMGSDLDVFVIRSPYYTHAQYCSPCAPGACYLLSPVDRTGPRAYCFGHDWFEGGRAPYPVYRVADGSKVEPESK